MFSSWGVEKIPCECKKIENPKVPAVHSRHSFLGSFHGLGDLEAGAEFPNIRGHSVARLK